ncbi:MAG: CDP-2,3-bis-(O-geranylgeranyl)-sn-glycerol synthase [Methanophagales archaeon]|nr:CDP-2,3-bis-(O-geranylgeranyl)-sn-glycerol synthase [Methanophagales archaeon]MCW3141622.1 CDP-2,3-bis-(O-geranylgeranyl)-sn-glycerol synthase [Methanophagales archaeon]
MNPVIETVWVAIWLMLPAYITNASAAFFGGKTPIDRGVLWRKNRLLGNGKTYEGLLTGFSCGFCAGIFQQLLGYIKMPSFGPFPSFLLTLFCLSAGAMLGDLLGSFIKRRAGLKRGAPLPLVDQLDFVGGAWLLLFLFAREWFIDTFSAEIIITVVIITPLLHLLTNYIGFKMGRKGVPW